jgi:hypothetical protein
LSAAQVEQLAAFLFEGPPQGRRAKDAPEPVIELEDPDGNGVLTLAAWTEQGRRVVVTVVYPVPPARTPCEAELDGSQAQSLGRYLSQGPPTAK